MRRPRRLRINENIRRLVRETKIDTDSFIYPLFVINGEGIKEEIPSMPEVFRFSVDILLFEIEECVELGVKAFILFGVEDRKDDYGSYAYREDGVIQKALKEVKSRFKEDVIIFTDVCLCGYTTHGHCGIIKNNYVDNDETLNVLKKIALSYAEFGSDFVAPSAMMDLQVKAIREELDENGFINVGIMSYSAKYQSAFYGPFREAEKSAPKFGNRSSYQMDFSNSKEALLEIEEDIKQGADIVMVKPALAYLDIISKAKQSFNVPIAAYNVSGEYSMIKIASRYGLFDERKIICEVLTSIKRSGADIILTYFAKQIPKWKSIL